MKMGRRLRCPRSGIDSDGSLYRQSGSDPPVRLGPASPARTALPAAHFDRNATTPVTDLVH
jgi:hypothetical protein